MPTRLFAAVTLVALLASPVGIASDWPRFRGPDGAGVSTDSAAVPTTWSDTENLKWKCELPGPGLSSPIVVGDRVYLTCWTGYEAGPDSSDNPEDLKRALVCVDRESGDIVWTKSVDAVLPENEFKGMFAENGYASHTPACDGQRIYCFFGKSGALAYDLEGNRLWLTSVGTGLDPRKWGSASSPVLYENLVIITASAESESLIALDRATGKEVWREEAPTLSGTWGTPVLVELDGGRTDLVISVPGEIWGVNPANGKLRWYCAPSSSDESSSATASVVVSPGAEPVAYVLGSRDSGAVAVRVGGMGDVTDSNIVWQDDHSGGIGTPVIHENRLYWISRGVANCIDTETGDEIYKERLKGGGGGNDRGYSSPIIAGGRLYYMSGGGDGYVIQLGDEFEQVAVNRLNPTKANSAPRPL